MTTGQQEKIFSEVTKKMKDIMISKAGDYANEKDVLSNFKLVAQIVGIPVELVLMVFIATKTVRLGNLLSSEKEPNNEGLDDTILDGCNYDLLLHMVREEKKLEAPSEGVIESSGIFKKVLFIDTVKNTCLLMKVPKKIIFINIDTVEESEKSVNFSGRFIYFYLSDIKRSIIKRGVPSDFNKFDYDEYFNVLIR